MTQPEHLWLANYPPQINWHTPIVPQILPDMLAEGAQNWPNRCAVDFMGFQTSYAEMWAQAQSVAQGLLGQGLKTGDRVGLCLPNTPYFVAGFFGILLAGGVVVNFNPLYTTPELVHQVNDSGTRFLITLDRSLITDKIWPVLYQTNLEKIILCPLGGILPPLKRVLASIFKHHETTKIPKGYGYQVLAWQRFLKTKSTTHYLPQLNVGDVALLQYTGGTTGVPKGAMLTHANLWSNMVQAERWFFAAQKGAEIMLGVLPFFHVFALSIVMNLGLRLGATIVALPRFELKQTLKTINHYKPTIFPAVPTIYTAINNFPQLKKFDVSSIKYCISGGAPLPAEVRSKFQSLTGCQLVEGYGLTETSPFVCCNPLGGVNKAGSVGLPMSQTVVAIIDPETLAEKPQGEVGEICLQGPQLMAGYWQKPDETAQAIINGFFHTGDLGYLDPQGYVFIVDRIKDMIITGGYKVYPRHVEEAVYEHPSVEECVCAGVPDTYRGENVKIWLKLKPNYKLNEKELREFLKERLSPIAMPRLIEFRDKPLPKTMIGKLSRKDLKSGK